MIYTNIRGIPCQVKVTSFVKDYFYGQGEKIDIVFSVYDRRGYKAPWLERKMTAKDKARIEQEIIDYHNQLEEP